MKNLIYLIIVLMGPVSYAHVIPHFNSTTYCTLMSDTCSLFGKVTEANTGEPVLFGDVAIYKNGILITGTQTDFDGNYCFQNLIPGVYEVEIAHVGFESIRSKAFTIIANQELSLDIQLSQGVQLTEVVITGYGIPRYKRDCTSSSSTISAADIKNLPTKNNNALASKTAGLSNKKGKTVTARGSRSSVTSYSIDGVRVKGKKSAKMAAESTKVVAVVKPIEQSLASKLTATEVNDFADWNFWSDIQETDFIHTSLTWKMNPQNRYSLQLKNNEGFALSGLKVELLDEQDNTLWTSISDNLGKVELFGSFIKDEKQATHVFVHHGDKIKSNFPVDLFNGNTQVLTLDKECETPEVLELAFLLDVSGSMRDEMNYLRSEIIDIVQKVTKSNKIQTIRVGLVTYQGHLDQVPIKFQPLTENISAITSAITENCRGGHHDEAMDEALRISVDNLGWSANSHKIAFVIGDQQVFSSDNYRSVLRENVKRSAAVGIKLVPIGCSGMPKALEYVMRAMAIGTGGTYLAITDDSGIGGRHTTPTTNTFDVKSLNNIIIDVITRYTRSNSCDDNQQVATQVDIDAIHENLNKKYGRQNSDQHIKLFPNPTTGPFSIRKRDNKTFSEAFICDMAGRIVKQLDVEQKEFDISEFAVGTYFLLYKTIEGVFGSEPLIKTGSQHSFVQN